MNPRVEAIIFDCDGVLVDSEVLALEVELSSLAEIGLDYSRSEFVARFTGRSNDAFFALLEEDSVARRGCGLPDGFQDACHAKYSAAYERLTEISGARAAVAAVTLPKAVASSSTRDALGKKLRLTQLWDFFEPHIYSCDHVVHAKPAPDLFLYAADALRIAPAACLVLEDSTAGVMAARAAGMRVWGFTGGGHMDEASGARLLAAGADRLIAGWSEAAGAFAALA
jgi:beta-phosphoglucomutase-like phosphatase (HAD superfamily)